MTLAADGYFGRGSVVSPLTSDTSNSLLEDSDPVIFHLLEYIAGVLNLHILPRWNQEVLRTVPPLTSLLNKCVAYKVPMDPLPYMHEAQFRFPLLAIFRTEDESKSLTIARDNEESTITIEWILPPLNMAQAERILPFQKHVFSTIKDRLLRGYDSNWNGGQRFAELAGIESLDVVRASYTGIQDLESNDKFFPTVMMTIKVRERREFVELEYSPLLSVGTDIDLENENESPVEDIVQLEDAFEENE